MADYVGRWDCETCGSEGIWGILPHCPNCGAPTTGKWYLPEGEPPTTSAEVQRIIKAGPNWVCGSCSSDNWGDHSNCTQCGASRGNSKTRRVVEHGLTDTPRNASQAKASFVVDEPVANQESRGVRDSRSSSASASHISASSAIHSQAAKASLKELALRNKKWIVAGVIILLAFFGIYFVTRTQEVSVQVDRFEWSRVINIDHFATVREGDWSVPAGGRYVSQETRIHHYDRVLDHYETKTRKVQSGSERYVCGTTNNGNGTFSDRYCSRPTYTTQTYQDPVHRQVPVYRPFYHYDIDKWIPYRTVSTGGQNRSDPEPHWGELVLRCVNQAVLGCERVSGRGEQYLVFFDWYEGDKEERHEYRMEENRADWDAYDQNDEYILIFNGLGMLLNDPLRPENH